MLTLDGDFTPFKKRCHTHIATEMAVRST